MNLNKPLKVLLGLGTIWPFVYFFLFVVSIIGLLMNSDHWGNEPPIEAILFFIIFFILYFITIILHIGLMVFCIIHIIKHKSLTEGYKIMWMILLFFMGFFTMPIYWIICIWPEPKENTGELIVSNTL